MDSVSGFWDRLGNPPSMEVADAFCCWTDLLGFSKPFVNSNWKPDAATWDAIHKRLSTAHSAYYRHLDMTPSEYVLTLNDGLVRSFTTDKLGHLDELSFWLRGCILSHIEVNKAEKQQGHPGARSVLSYGPRLVHGHPEFRLDDFVFTYTKRDPAKPSKLATMTGNPQIVSNPLPLQMNVAFSRAYILDQLGSAVSLSGSSFYVDETVVEACRSFAARLAPEAAPIWESKEEKVLFAVPKRKERYFFGFEFAMPSIAIEVSQIRTSVWRVSSFFPCDEDISEFKFELA